MPKRSPRFKEAFICQACGRTTVKRSAVQKYCTPCSDQKSRERKNRWQKSKYASDPALREQISIENRKRRKDKNRAVRERGAVHSKAAARNIAWYGESEPDLHTVIRVCVPFSYIYSKNRLWSFSGGQGHVYQRQTIKNARAALALLIRQEAHGKFKKGKVWIDLLVQKPNHKGDAVNVLDLVCDAVYPPGHDARRGEEEVRPRPDGRRRPAERSRVDTRRARSSIAVE